MDATILGTGNPIPQLERGGTSIALKIGEDVILIDCGQQTTHRLVENGIDFTEIEDVFFTHHHLDHNADFYYFAQVGWFLGRDNLSVYGPKGTSELIEGLNIGYDYNINTWQTVGGYHTADQGIRDIDEHRISDDFKLSRDGWTVTAMKVEHDSIICYAYRFDELTTGSSFVYTGDTRQMEEMADFAKDADILVHNCNARGEEESSLSPDEVSPRYTEPPFDRYYEIRTQNTVEETAERHSRPHEAAETARKANVDKLVLTHFDHYRDPTVIYEEANSIFEGEVYVAEDGLNLKTD